MVVSFLKIFGHIRRRVFGLTITRELLGSANRTFDKEAAKVLVTCVFDG
jgi:hypothetical protein